MLNNHGFDLWADNYDKSVETSDENGKYPFAGYRTVLNEIYNTVLASDAKTVLDIGFGTGTLITKLYEHGYDIYGQDFSEKMIELAQRKMPSAKLFKGDFSDGLAEPLKQQKYDVIVATYSLHHLTDEQKVRFINNLLTLLSDNGCIYIGDVAFPTRDLLNECMIGAGNEWDSDEIYFVFDELKRSFPNMEFKQISYCSALMTLHR